jgi:hypothetical protein
MASQEGFEPPTYGLEGRCSILLSYWLISCPNARLPNNTNVHTTATVVKIVFGAGDGNRTHATSLEGWYSTIE